MRSLSTAEGSGETERLEQVVHHVQFVAFDGVLVVGGGKDDLRWDFRVFKNPGLQFGQVDVEEKYIHRVVFQKFDGAMGASTQAPANSSTGVCR